MIAFSNDPKRNTIFHQAAYISFLTAVSFLLAQVFVLIIIGLFNTLNFNAGLIPPFVRWFIRVIEWISLYILPMVGGVCGIIGLSGIPRYGSEGLLWKSLIGLMYWVTLILLALFFIFAHR